MQTETIIIPEKNGNIIQINQSEIVFIEVENKIPHLHLVNGLKIKSKKTFQESKEELNDGLFFQIHRLYIINKLYLKYFNKHLKLIVLNNGATLAVAKRRLTALSNFLNN